MAISLGIEEGIDGLAEGFCGGMCFTWVVLGIAQLYFRKRMKEGHELVWQQKDYRQQAYQELVSNKIQSTRITSINQAPSLSIHEPTSTEQSMGRKKWEDEKPSILPFSEQTTISVKNICPNCHEPVEPEWVACPVCERVLSRKLCCPNCASEIEGDWVACPSCERELPRNTNCPKCHCSIEETWLACPFCEESLQ